MYLIPGRYRTAAEKAKYLDSRIRFTAHKIDGEYDLKSRLLDYEYIGSDKPKGDLATWAAWTRMYLGPTYVATHDLSPI